MRWKVAAVIGLVLTCANCGARQPRAVFVDPALETLIPPDTTFAAGADLDAIRTTHVFQKYLSQMKLRGLEELTKKTGIDARKDVWQILSCSNGKSGFFLARGKFSSEQEPEIKIEGVERLGYKGYTMYGNEQSSVLFVNTSTVVAGRTADLRTLVDLRNQGNHGFPATLKAKIATIAADRQIWAAFVGGLQSVDLGFPENSNAGQALQLLRGIDSGTIGIDLRNGFNFDARLDCRSNTDAKHIHDALRGVIGIGRLSTPNNQPDLLKLYDTIQVTQDQNKVSVTAQIAPELEDKFLDVWLKVR